jgi:hypothetical protein
MRRVTARNGTVFDAYYAWLEFVRDGIGRFHEGRNRGSIDLTTWRHA